MLPQERRATKERNLSLYQFYNDLIKRHGIYAKFIPKEILYEEVGEKFSIGKRRAYEIIKKMMRHGCRKDQRDHKGE